MCSLPRPSERVDRPQRRVDRPQQRRQRRLGLGCRRLGVAAACGRVGGDHAGGDPPSDACRAASRSYSGPASARSVAPGRDLPLHAVADSGRASTRPSGRPVDVEHLERLVDVIGQQEARDRVDRGQRRRISSIVASAAWRGRVGRGVDEPKQPPRGPGQPWAHAQHVITRSGTDLVTRGHESVADGQIEGAAERIDDPALRSAVPHPR